MSKHRASSRSPLRFAPLGAGMTAALMAAGTGSAFALPAEGTNTAATLSCDDALAKVGASKTAVDKEEKERDVARATLQSERQKWRAAQAPYEDALDDRNDALERFESLEKRQARKATSLSEAKNKVASRDTALAGATADVVRLEAEIKKETSPAKRRQLQRQLATARDRVADAERALRSAGRGQARAESELTTAKSDTERARQRLDDKEKALTAAGPAPSRDKVTAAAQELRKAEAELDTARAAYRTARSERAQACTDGVSTLPQA